MSDTRQPILLLVDDDESALAELGEVVTRRYGNDYSVGVEASATAALRRLEQARADGEEVALVIADQWMPELDGIPFLTRVQDLHPHAKRALLIDTFDPTALAPMLQASTLGRIDHHLHKPWAPPDDQLHPAITELLAEWARHHHPRVELVRIIGDQWDARSHELRDLLERNNITYGFHDAASPRGQELLRSLGATAERLPIVALHNGLLFIQPSNVELAAAFGARTSAPAEPSDLAIIGAGPAGLAAAVYGASEGLRTLVVERQAMGGQAGTSSMIRNYLGFPRGVSGSELAGRAYSQAWHLGAEFIFAQEATALRAEDAMRVITLTDGGEIRARAVVLGTGVTYRRMPVPSIDRLLGAGVFYGAANAEAKALQGQHVYVVGAANSAGQAAVHLAKYAARVTLVARRTLAATMSAYLMKEIHRTKNIEVRLNTEVIEARGSHRLEGLVLRNARTGATDEVAAAALFILIGAVPHTEWLDGVVQRDERGFVLTGAELARDHAGAPWPLERAPYMLETSMPGVFAAGDVRHRSVKRVAAAVGEGSMAISSVHEYLSADHAISP